jgi:pyruvate dehydrogenase E1 component alpha subunit
MKADRWSLYRQMLRSRLFEESVRDLWQEGLISGEMHLGLGEEAIAVGVGAHLGPDDYLVLDHRGTPPLVARGVDLGELLDELLGRPDGLCSGYGGHMHLLSPEHRAASSGIVGAAAPAAVGFALAAQSLRPGSLAVAYFGEGAMNQGMVMEALNLAVVWRVPVLFVCKDNDWAITTRSSSVTAGRIGDRARAFGLPVSEVDGSDVLNVWEAVHSDVREIRRGKGPSFLLARCVHIEGHFLGDPLLRVARKPIEQIKEMAGPLLRSAGSGKGASLGKRLAGLGRMSGSIAKAAVDDRRRKGDPLPRIRRRLLRADRSRLARVEKEVRSEIEAVVEAALSV